MGDWAIVDRESNSVSDKSVEILAMRPLSEIMIEGAIVSMIVFSGGDWEGMVGTQAVSAANSKNKICFKESGTVF